MRVRLTPGSSQAAFKMVILREASKRKASGKYSGGEFYVGEEAASVHLAASQSRKPTARKKSAKGTAGSAASSRCKANALCMAAARHRETPDEKSTRLAEQRRLYHHARAQRTPEEASAQAAARAAAYRRRTGREGEPYPDYERDPRQALDYFAESSVNACEAATDYLRKPGGVEIVKEALLQELLTDEKAEKIRESFLRYTDDGPGGVELLGCASCGERDYSPLLQGGPKTEEKKLGAVHSHEGYWHVHVSQLDQLFQASDERLRKIESLPTEFPPPPTDPDGPPVNLQEVFALFRPADGGAPLVAATLEVCQQADSSCTTSITLPNSPSVMGFKGVCFLTRRWTSSAVATGWPSHRFFAYSPTEASSTPSGRPHMP